MKCLEQLRSWWFPYLKFAIFSSRTSLYYLLLLHLQALIFTYFHLFFFQPGYYDLFWMWLYLQCHLFVTSEIRTAQKSS